MTTWEEEKRGRNIAKHGVDLSMAQNFEFEASLVVEDVDEAYGEQRFVAIGPIGGRLYVYVYVLNSAATEERAISLGLAERMECRRYAREI